MSGRTKEEERAVFETPEALLASRGYKRTPARLPLVETHDPFKTAGKNPHEDFDRKIFAAIEHR